MAVAANYLASGNVLIVAPAEYLTEQICDHLNQKFWSPDHAGFVPREGPKKAIAFVPSTLGRELEKADGPRVYVCTPQTLSMLHENHAEEGPRDDWSEAFDRLRARIDFVVVDEGHREPAKYWARAVRMLKRPTLLFSATPYRNDFRFFNLGQDEEFLFEYKFQDAVRDQIIRDVEFVAASEPYRGDATQFVRLLRSFYYGDPRVRTIAKSSDRQPRVIVRCSDATSVRDVIEAFVAEGEPRTNVIGIHDTFEMVEDENYFVRVPDPKKNDAVFWVHQFKLAEGVDDPSFRIIAFYQPFANARSLVQQVGRVLRNPGRSRGQKAFVFCEAATKLDEQWKGYREFERTEGALISPEQIVTRFMESLPKWFYIDGQYRQPAGLKPDDVEDQLRVSRSADIFRVPSRFSRKDFIRLVDDTVDVMEQTDIIEVDRLPDDYEESDFILSLAWRVAQTDLLVNDGLFEVGLVPGMFYWKDEYLFYQGPASLRETRDYERLELVTAEELERLLAGNAKVTQVSLVNCDLGKNSVRRRSMGARAVADLAPGLSDHFHYVSRAGALVGPEDDRVSRYVGLSRGHVSEDVSVRVPLDEYRAWCDSIADTLADASSTPPPLLARYARPVRAPAAAKARHLLIDVHEFLEEFDYRHRVPAADIADFPDRFQATASEVSASGVFECEISNAKVTGRVFYRPLKKRFEIESEALDEMFYDRRAHRRLRRRRKPSSFISTRPIIRIVTEEGQLYADRRFYEPRLPLWGKDRIKNLGLIIDYPPLANVDDKEKEKGKRGTVFHGLKTWPAGSIFHLIDHDRGLFRAAGWNDYDYLICDDMGTETADFVVVDRAQNRIALLHAKYGGGSLSSAREFQIVHAQATKNLEFFNPSGTFLPDRTERWAGAWQGALRRIRLPRRRRSADVLAAEIDTMLRSSDVTKEVWIVLGRGFSKSVFTDQLSVQEPKKPPYHAIQLAYLLQACNANTSSVGATLKVLTVP